MKKLYYILMLLCLAPLAKAQDTTDMVALNTVLHADARLDIILKKKTSSGTGIYSGRGYRVQIYNGSDRTKATKTKIDFQRRFPNVRAYMTYASPRFRVKVGDFRTRGEAQDLYRQLSTLYNPCMIVPDIVVFRNFSSNKDKND